MLNGFGTVFVEGMQVFGAQLANLGLGFLLSLIQCSQTRAAQNPARRVIAHSNVDQPTLLSDQLFK